MSPREPTPDPDARRAARRQTLESLASAVRDLVEATVSTGLELQELEATRDEVRRLTNRLNEKRHRGIYSGLLGRGPLDHGRPYETVPLSPWMGRCNPLAPPLELEFPNGEVRGHVILGKRYIGPPKTAHGGVVAGILDQLLASASQAAGVPGVTARMTVHFRAPTPLYTELGLRAWADPRDDRSAKRIVHAEIRAGERVTAQGEALVVRPRWTLGDPPQR